MVFLKSSLYKTFLNYLDSCVELFNNYKYYIAVALFSASITGIAIFLLAVPRLEPDLEVLYPSAGINKNDAVVSVKSASASADILSGKVNINTAGIDQLSTLYNIGPKRAEAIIEYREKKLFKSTLEIKNVVGIGEKTYEKIKDRITVDR